MNVPIQAKPWLVSHQRNISWYDTHRLLKEMMSWWISLYKVW